MIDDLLNFFDAVGHGFFRAGLIGIPFGIVWYLLCFAFILLICLPILLIVWIISLIPWPILVLAALGMSLWQWEFFVRWYFLLTPHPAASMVRDAIHSGVELDERAFTDILRDPPLSKVGRDARNEQAAKLAAMARMSNAELRRKEVELRRRVEEEAKYQAAHSDLMDAMVEQQLAKARADAYAKAEEFWRSRRKT